MRKTLHFAGLILPLIIACAATVSEPPEENEADLRLNLPPYQGEKMTVAVIDLANRTDFDDPRIGQGVSRMLITALVNSGRFSVVERDEKVLSKLIDEQKLGMTGAVTSETAAEAGKLLGARAVVVGEVSEFGIRKTGAFVGAGGTRTITTRVVIDARLVDAETAEVLAGETGVGTSRTRTSGVALTFEFGTEGFDETTIGIAARRAVNRVAEKFARTAEKIGTTQ
ncbi:MAG: CsgG/HfaB family protein [bacterium]|nr:CsgG/HfaB family protein [bacterium]